MMMQASFSSSPAPSRTTYASNDLGTISEDKFVDGVVVTIPKKFDELAGRSWIDQNDQRDRVQVQHEGGQWPHLGQTEHLAAQI